MRALQLAVIGIIGIVSLSAEELKVDSLRAPAPRLVKEAGARGPSKSVLTKRDDLTNTNSLSVFEMFTGLVIPGGQSLNLFGQMDYTGASTVSIGISCPASTNLQNTQVFVYWQIPAFNSEYTGTTGFLGSGLLYTNMGGNVVPVFGNSIGIQVKNVGSSAVACDQLTVYGVVH